MWTGLVDGVYAIGITLVMLESPNFWSEVTKLVREGSLSPGDAGLLFVDHAICLVVSAIICIDLWGLTSVAYRSPGKRNKMTTFWMIASLISGISITIAFQSSFAIRMMEVVEKSAIETRGPEVGLFATIIGAYIICGGMLGHVRRKPTIESCSTSETKKLKAAKEHCFRSCLILGTGIVIYGQTKEDILGIVALIIAVAANWVHSESSWMQSIEKKLKRAMKMD